LRSNCHCDVSTLAESWMIMHSSAYMRPGATPSIRPVRKPVSSARSLISRRTSCRLLTDRAIVAQGCIGWEQAAANRSIRRTPERHLSRRDSPVPLPGWCGGDRGHRGMTFYGYPSVPPAGPLRCNGSNGCWRASLTTRATTVMRVVRKSYFYLEPRYGIEP